MRTTYFERKPLEKDKSYNERFRINDDFSKMDNHAGQSLGRSLFGDETHTDRYLDKYHHAAMLGNNIFRFHRRPNLSYTLRPLNYAITATKNPYYTMRFSCPNEWDIIVINNQQRTYAEFVKDCVLQFWGIHSS